MTTDVAAGLGFPLDCGLGTFAVVGGTSKLEQSMTLILRTYPGERVMRPDFGCRLRDFVFETVTPAAADRLAEEVRWAINTCEPRARVDRVDVVPDPAVDGLVHLVIGYRHRETGEDHELAVDFRTDRGGD